MNQETLLSAVVMAIILIPAAYGTWRWIASLGQDSGAACGSCGSAPTRGCALWETRGADPTRLPAPDLIRQTVLYVSHLTEDNASRLSAAVLALDGVEAATARPAARTLQVAYRPGLRSLCDVAHALAQAAREEPQPEGEEGANERR